MSTENDIEEVWDDEDPEHAEQEGTVEMFERARVKVERKQE